MLVDIPDDLVPDVVVALHEWATWFRATDADQQPPTDAEKMDILADGIERRRADLTPAPEVTAETLTEDAVGRLMVLMANVPDAEMRTRCQLWLDYSRVRATFGPSIAAEINRRAKADRHG